MKLRWDLFDQPDPWLHTDRYAHIPKFISTCEVDNITDYYNITVDSLSSSDSSSSDDESSDEDESTLNKIASFSPLKQLSRISLEDIKQIPREISDAAQRPVRRIKEFIFGQPSIESEVQTTERMIDSDQLADAFWKKLTFPETVNGQKGLHFARTYSNMRRPFAFHNRSQIITSCQMPDTGCQMRQVEISAKELTAANNLWNTVEMSRHLNAPPANGNIPIRSNLSMIVALSECHARIYWNASRQDYTDLDLAIGDALIVDSNAFIETFNNTQLLIMYILFVQRNNVLDVRQFIKK